MKIVAVIPARGGSKRIPRKNIRPFAGKPMISYSIQAAFHSRLFDKIVVSTDDDEIAKVALEYGAEVPFMRPRELADDFTGTSAVVKHALQWHIDNGDDLQYVCCIYATAPFIKPEYLREGYEMLVANDCSYAFSVTRFPFPIQRAVRVTSDHRVAPFFPQYVQTRSQDLEESFHDAGQFYWGKVSAFLDDIPLFSPASVPIVLPSYLVQDIDTPEDWTRAEYMHAALMAAGA